MQLPPRLESLVVKTGLHLGVLCGPDRDLVLALAACGVEPGQPLREVEVNQRLVDWLVDLGQMLCTDHVELRRWLVDAEFVARDDWGHAYVRGRANVELARQALGSTDSAALTTAVRSARVAGNRRGWRGAGRSRVVVRARLRRFWEITGPILSPSTVDNSQATAATSSREWPNLWAPPMRADEPSKVVRIACLTGTNA